MGNRSISITVHPSSEKGEYLTVEDAMRQVLDMIETVECSENPHEAKRKIVWRLTEAHTNSPPFTVTAEAFSKDPEVSVSLEASRVMDRFKNDVTRLFDGEPPRWMGSAAEKAIHRLLARNLNGVAYTGVNFDGEPAFSVNPVRAQKAIDVIERSIDQDIDGERTEMGTAEGEVIGLTKYYSSPALIVRERISGTKVYCVLSEDLAEKIGPEHSWLEAWQDLTHRFSGELVYGKDGFLKRIIVSHHEQVDWKDISLSQLKDVNVIENKSIQEHLDEFWGEKLG
ncbi:hypothetical protein ACFOW6_16600 [Fodinicurvata halophila]|uniref:Uncharacterized protein n=1 Tax=Fodinicurvata halophila TaxID=1419723 RepID=A0ABV8UQZ0_9PROT